MAQHDRGVHRLARQQKTNRTPDGDASAEHADLFAVQVDVIGIQQFDHTSRSTRQRRGNVTSRVQHKFAKIVRMHAIRILLGVYQINDGVFVNTFRQRQLHDIG